jgi:DNA-binding MarR family transcriptional regulator
MSLHLTPAGEQLLNQTAAPVQQAYEQLMAPLTPHQSAQFIVLLQQLTDGLGDQARAAFVPLARQTSAD